MNQEQLSENTRTNMSKKKFRIGELAKELQVKKFVIRFWEKEFELKLDRSQGGQRYYTEDDFKAFNAIKYLLYEQGFTIAGAKTQLEQIIKKPETHITAATKTELLPASAIPQEFLYKVRAIKAKLLQLKKDLD